jgi:hypothetical protein
MLQYAKNLFEHDRIRKQAKLIHYTKCISRFIVFNQYLNIKHSLIGLFSIQYLNIKHSLNGLFSNQNIKHSLIGLFSHQYLNIQHSLIGLFSNQYLKTKPNMFLCLHKELLILYTRKPIWY